MKVVCIDNSVDMIPDDEERNRFGRTSWNNRTRWTIGCKKYKNKNLE